MHLPHFDMWELGIYKSGTIMFVPGTLTTGSSKEMNDL
jgi:hypothetical protein